MSEFGHYILTFSPHATVSPFKMIFITFFVLFRIFPWISEKKNLFSEVKFYRLNEYAIPM